MGIYLILSLFPYFIGKQKMDLTKKSMMMMTTKQSYISWLRRKGKYN